MPGIWNRVTPITSTEATKTIAARHQIVIGLICEAHAGRIRSGNPFAPEGLVANRWIKDFLLAAITGMGSHAPQPIHMRRHRSSPIAGQAMLADPPNIVTADAHRMTCPARTVSCPCGTEGRAWLVS